ncbi:MAG TPA: FAD-binding protein, partial [Polyangiales bacterium]|nr:FAD-binding protein [Polyangiales bacterium]
MHKMTKRGFTRALVGAPLIAGIHALTRSSATLAQSAGPGALGGLPALDGTWLSDETTRETYARDYGLIVHERPRAVLRPGSLEDVVRIVRFARRNQLPIAARGHGHQPFGQAQVQDGIVIDMRSLATVHAASEDRIEVDAGADWRAVLAVAVRNGRTPAVLPAYLGLTVGGTLSIGGLGIATLRHGAQVDGVQQLQVVTGEGDVVRCSEREHADLFQAVLAGQGQCAIIARAQLRSTAAKPMIREYALRYADLAPLLADEAALLRDDRFDGVVAMIVPDAGSWSYTLIASRAFAPAEPPDDVAMTAGLHAIAGSERRRDVEYAQYMEGVAELHLTQSHADLGLLVPGSAAPRFIASTLARLRPDDLGAVAALRVFSWPRAAFTRPLLRLPEQETVVYLALLRAETTDAATLARQLAG